MRYTRINTKEVKIVVTLRKGLVFSLALMVAAFPVFSQLAPGMESQAAVGERTPVPLPEGNELSDEELLDAESEFFFIAAALAFSFGAALAAWNEQYNDEDYGVDWDDASTIVAGGVGGVGFLLIGGYAR